MVLSIQGSLHRSDCFTTMSGLGSFTVPNTWAVETSSPVQTQAHLCCAEVLRDSILLLLPHEALSSTSGDDDHAVLVNSHRD